jgi:copper(I)-binding protein
VKRRFANRMAALLLALVAAAHGGQVSPPTVEVRDAWVRWLPGTVPAAGYVTLVNDTDVTFTLTGASSFDYGNVSLHQSRQQGGVSSMVPVSAITIKPHSTLVFGNEGYHLMLMQPKKTLKPGDSVRIDLHFSNGMLISPPFQLRSPDMLMSR